MCTLKGLLVDEGSLLHVTFPPDRDLETMVLSALLIIDFLFLALSWLVSVSHNGTLCVNVNLALQTQVFR